MSAKAIVITLVVVFIGAAYLMLALLGPLKDVNMGLGLTAGLAAQKIAGGYSMANVVLFIVFLVVIGVLAYLWIGEKNKKKGS